MANKYRIVKENGGSYEVANIEDIPNGVTYETIEIIELTEEEIAKIENSKVALFEAYPELVGMNYKLIQLDNLEEIKRLEPISDKGLKGVKKYVKDAVLIWSIETKFWFEDDATYLDGVVKTIKIYDKAERVVDSWVKRVELSSDDKENIRKVQRDRILTYFKSQQEQLFQFLYMFFKDEINNYIAVGNKDAFEAILNDASLNHPYQDGGGNYIVKLTLLQEVTTQSGGTTTVLQGILDELV
jgi:hypothetical protein